MAKSCTLVFLALLCLLLSACGKSDPPAPSEPPVSVSQSEAPSPPPVLTPEQSEEPSEEPSPEPTFAIDEDRQDALYNHSHFQAVYLRMDKADIEAFYKPSPPSAEGFISYDGGGFFVKYYGNDTVKELVIYEKSSWETFNGVTVGTTLAELKEAYGEPLAAAENSCTYYTLENELLREPPSLTEVDINYLYTLTFLLENEVVNCIILSRF